MLQVNQPADPRVRAAAIAIARRCVFIVQACLREEERIEALRSCCAINGRVCCILSIKPTFCDDAQARLDKKMLQDVLSKTLSPPTRRGLVAESVGRYGVSVRRACEATQTTAARRRSSPAS